MMALRGHQGREGGREGRGLIFLESCVQDVLDGLRLRGRGEELLMGGVASRGPGTAAGTMKFIFQLSMD